MEQVPALSKNRLAREEVEGEEEGRRLGRESGRRSSDVVRAVVPSTRQGEKKTGDEEGRRRVVSAPGGRWRSDRSIACARLRVLTAV